MPSKDQRAEIRKREREYEADVDYEVYRRGGNVDAVGRDRVRDHYDNGLDADSAASVELRRQRPINRHDGWAEEQQEEPFPEEQFAEE